MAFFFKFKFNYRWKMRRYPQFSLWILIALAKICFFPHTVINRRHIENWEYPGDEVEYYLRTVCAVTKGGTVLNEKEFVYSQSVFVYVCAYASV